MKPVDDYRHSESRGARVPDAGAQPYLKSDHAPGQYRYDSSLSPSLEWDEQNPTREQAEALIAEILQADSLDSAKAAAAKLKAMSMPFLNWAGKAERPNLEVPTLPLFVHERLSTKGIIETLNGHRRNRNPGLFDNLFNDSQLPIGEQTARAYEHGPWSNRMILGENLQVMNWLLQGENLGGQVQMIYMDPPYGIKYGSNFQPFVRSRDVTHNDDDNLTRELEMVQAYRDTWELGLHSYLTYLRDRLTVARSLLNNRGSIFLQISDENLHHVREILDDVFGSTNFVSQISFQTTTGFETKYLATLGDYLLWYAKDKEQLKIRKVFEPQPLVIGEGYAKWVRLRDGTYRGVTAAEKRREVELPKDAEFYSPDNLISQGASPEPQPFEYQGKVYTPGANSHWKANYPNGMNRLAEAGRIHVAKNSIRFRRLPTDFPFSRFGNHWTDTLSGSFLEPKTYVVQTNPKVIARCLHLTTDPGDLVLDPTCGSGTTSYVAEQWGRRWLTIDVSRVPLALARQRLLTATYNWYVIKDEVRGPVSGFVYQRKKNRNGKEVGGIVPHITLESIANGEPPVEEVLVDRPEVNDNVIRVTGPFTFEASIPKAVDDREETSTTSESFAARLLYALRRSPRLHLPGNQSIEVKNVRLPSRSLSLSAEGELVNGTAKQVAFLFGPENGPITEKQVMNALRESHGKGFDRLFVTALSIQPGARVAVENAERMGLPPAIYLQVTPDLLMGDLLKNMKSSQVFSVCGLPEVAVRPHGVSEEKPKRGGKGKKPPSPGSDRWQVELIGLDVFDPVTMQTIHRGGNDVPAWFLDTDYNEKCFHVCQAFFPRTAAWDNLKRELKADYEEGLWDHLAGTTSAPFEAGEHRQVAVKVIDDRGNELMVVKPLAKGK